MEIISSRTFRLVLVSFLLIAAVFYRVGYQHAKGITAVTPAARVQSTRQRPSGDRAPRPLAAALAPAAVTAPAPPVAPTATLPSVEPTATPPVAGLGAVCARGWDALARSTLEDTRVTLITDRRLVLPMDCLLRMKEDALPPTVRRFVDECQLGLAARDPARIETDCGGRLAEFRAWVLRQARGGISDLAELEAADLANQLYGGFLETGALRVEDLDRNIAIADELIARDPNLYAGYKGKLLSLLQKELRYGQAVDGAEYEKLYEQMTEFRGFPKGAPEEGLTAPAELGQIDSDLVHIPFLRAAALGDGGGLTAMAQEYIQAYPQSYVGYYYLAKSQWSQGDQAGAIATFQAMLGPSASPALALEMLQRTQGKTALERLQEMKIE